MAVRGGLAIAVVLVSACGLIGPTPPPQPPRQTSMGLSISGLQLTNGLRVVLVQDPRAREIQVTMRYQVGTIDDPPGQAGVAHLVEHLMFQQILGGKTLFSKLEDDATFFTGLTSLDATTYIERASPTHLEEMLSIEAVRVGFRCTSVTDAVFVRERAVVMNELALRGEVRELALALQDSVYPEGHPYRHGIATTASIATITRDQACAFADAHYAPGNAVLVVSGNLGAKTLETALGKFIAKVAKRDVAAPTQVPLVVPTGVQTRVPGPVDDEVLIVAWALPRDLAERAKVRGLMSVLRDVVDARIKGWVGIVPFGGIRAPMLALVVIPTTGETTAQALGGVKEALADLPTAFRSLGKIQLGEATFDRIRQTAIYAAYASLDDRAERDIDLAGYVLDGVDPTEAVGEQFRGLREMNRNDAAQVAEEVLRLDRAMVVVMHPTGAKKLGRTPEIHAEIHDMGQRRDLADPAEAHRPATGELPPRTLPEVTTRVLPNGLKIVLMPVTSVPTVDVRLVFNAGTADEPADRRGAALLAGYELSWSPRYFNDYLAFTAAGGTDGVHVGFDVTTFEARGLDMHIDVLLAGLRRWVRDGRYDSGSEMVTQGLRHAAKLGGDLGVFTDTWRAALYGEGHPYVEGGLARRASKMLEPEHAKDFRAAHFTPDNATLVISGRFNAPLVEQWINFLFADWTGRAERRTAVATAPRVASLAIDADTAQVGVAIAIRAGIHPRAQQLIGAEMLDEIAGDVRHQLGASYSLNASLVEQRLATTYDVLGFIDASRTREAIELLRTRIAQLRGDPDLAARAFVAARGRVLTQLAASEGTASQLAGRVQHDVELGRPPLSDLATAVEVQQLTIDAMGPTLAELDLGTATILMMGPAADVDAAFAVLGRTAQHTTATKTDEIAAQLAPTHNSDTSFSLSDLAEPLTGPRFSRLRFTAVPFALVVGRVLDARVTGYGFTGGAELRIDRTLSAGLHLSFASVDGTKDVGQFASELQTVEALPITVSAALHSSAYDRIWGGFSIGLHATRYLDNGEPPLWDYGVGLGLEAGADILKLGRHRVGVYAALQFDLFTTTQTALFSGGLAYRL